MTAMSRRRLLLPCPGRIVVRDWLASENAMLIALVRSVCRSLAGPPDNFVRFGWIFHAVLVPWREGRCSCGRALRLLAAAGHRSLFFWPWRRPSFGRAVAILLNIGQGKTPCHSAACCRSANSPKSMGNNEQDLQTQGRRGVKRAERNTRGVLCPERRRFRLWIASVSTPIDCGWPRLAFSRSWT